MFEGISDTFGEGISDTFDTWTRGTCTRDSCVENN